MTHVEGFLFDRDSASVTDPGHSGRYVMTMSDRWFIGDKVNGGFLLAVATRAMGAAIDEATAGAHPHVISVTSHYLRPGVAGSTEIDTEVVRVGRKLSTATAVLGQQGKARIQTVASFGNLADATGFSVSDGAPPELPTPEECLNRGEDPSIPLNSHSIANSLEIKIHPETAYLNGRPGDGKPMLRGYMRFVDGRPVDVWSLPLFADAMPPSIFEIMPERIWVPTVELTVHVRGVPAPGWLRCMTTTRFVQDGFFEEDGEIWDSSGRLVAVSRQLAMVFKP